MSGRSWSYSAPAAVSGPSRDSHNIHHKPENGSSAKSQGETKWDGTTRSETRHQCKDELWTQNTSSCSPLHETHQGQYDTWMDPVIFPSLRLSPPHSRPTNLLWSSVMLIGQFTAVKITTRDDLKHVMQRALYKKFMNPAKWSTSGVKPWSKKEEWSL